ncbi:unnamed protein product [Lymnaea stagnalis]|uniref:C-type lectin domain-containing protein n=1 Tax=Lymnaea stagnalis TaxID=6523 RepID=A0AAV2HLI4_LYMST
MTSIFYIEAMTRITCLQGGLLLFGLAYTSVTSQPWPCQWKDSVYAEGSCFLYYAVPMAYSTATNNCKDRGGVLAALSSIKPIEDYLGKIPTGDEVWIGADNKTGRWTWLSTGNEATELGRFWADGEPSKNPDNNCAYISSGKLYNGDCSDVKKILCMEKDLLTSVSSTLNSEAPTTQSTLKEESATNTGQVHISMAPILTSFMLCFVIFYILV